MTTDAERREATDLWTIQLREQQLNAAVQLAQQDERNVELKAQLAERNLVVEQLQMALSVRDTQLAAVTAERDDYRAKFRELEHELQLERGQVVAQQQRAEAAEARLLAMQVDRSKTVKLRDDTDNVIWSLKPADVPGAINWGDLGCREVQEVINDERRWYRVIIEEADPSNPALHAAVLAGLVALGWDPDDIELETAW